MAAEIEVLNLKKKFGRVIAIKNINLKIKKGEFLVLLGPSGCGKTTTLRCIAGLEKPDEGKIFINEKDVTNLPPSKRNLSMVFQNYAVFPHMTVRKNIEFGLRIKKFDKEEIENRVKKSAELLKIDELLERYPSQLSGGQRQRVAIARAIATHPEILLLDEPLSNLDALLRLKMRAELKKLHRDTGTTTVYVTHDQVEALSLGDRIAVMFDGEIVQIDTPRRIYDFPVNVKVGGFIGTPPMNFLKAVVEEENILIDKFKIKINRDAKRLKAGETIIGIRAENIKVYKNPDKGDLKAEVVVSEPLGSNNLLTLRIGEEILKVITEPDLTFKTQEIISISFNPEKIRFFDPETGEATDVVSPE